MGSDMNWAGNYWGSRRNSIELELRKNISQGNVDSEMIIYSELTSRDFISPRSMNLLLPVLVLAP